MSGENIIVRKEVLENIANRIKIISRDLSSLYLNIVDLILEEELSEEERGQLEEIKDEGEYSLNDVLKELKAEKVNI